jgi:SAM-dependent methyltransferase
MKNRLIALRNALALRFFPRRRIFELIHRERLWQGDESVSGMGSNLANTANIRAALPALLARHEVRRLLDLPCGDGHWIRHVPLAGIDYLGADIVAGLIRDNRAGWSDATHRFAVLDLCRDPLPEADVLLCRDALVHLSNRDLARALNNIRHSPIRYLLTTSFTDPARANPDIRTGEWRPLNLQAAPWHFPPPEELINEGYRGDGGHYADKSLALWRIAALPESFAA